MSDDDDEARRRWIADHVEEWIAGVHSDALFAVQDYQRRYAGKPKPLEYSETLKRLADLLEPDDAGLEPVRRPPDHHVVPPTPMLSDEDVAAIQEDNRHQFTISLACDLAGMIDDVKLISGMSEGMPVQPTLQDLIAPLERAYAAVLEQNKRDAPAG